MYDAVATLYSQGTERVYDAYGNETILMTAREVYVQPRGVYRSEFYSAAQAGLHPSVTLELTNREDYQGETLVEFEGRMYDIIRTDWNAQRDNMSIILQERINGND